MLETEEHMEKLIFYFSGTGNSLRTARIIAGEIGGARLISMRSDPAGISAAKAEISGNVAGFKMAVS